MAQTIENYEVLEILGRGGMGTVYKCRNEKNDLVAIKVLHSTDDLVIKKFFDEALILAKLEHPNITKIYQFFPHRKSYAIVMEYVEGVTLKHVIRQNKGSYQNNANICRQILDAVQLAHEQNIIHRDIKPANIMITKNGDAKVMDFGIAKISSGPKTDTTIGPGIGTPRYGAPEQFIPGSEIDARSDIYALGALFYELYAGSPPFSGNARELIEQHRELKPDSPRKYSQNIPKQAERAILKALEKKPGKRFSDCKAFKSALVGDDETDNKQKKWVAAAILICGLAIAAACWFFITPKWDQKTIEIAHPVDGSVMIKIPSGKFVMGSDVHSYEKPVQTIYLDEYYIDKYPVTNRMFGKFITAKNYKTDAEKNERGGMVRRNRKWRRTPGANWKAPEGLAPIDANNTHPVRQVSYNDAAAYCQWAQKSLPTEAQWEKAARGPDGNTYPWGNEPPGDRLANFENIVGTSTPVNRYDAGQSQPYGLYDMAGNVYDWCEDWYDTYDKNLRQVKNPTGPTQDKGRGKVLKGGSFIEGKNTLRSSNRIDKRPDYSSFLFGFRCACENIDK